MECVLIVVDYRAHIARGQCDECRVPRVGIQRMAGEKGIEENAQSPHIGGEAVCLWTHIQMSRLVGGRRGRRAGGRR